MKVEIQDLTRPEIDELLSAQKVGYLSLANGDVPYCIPLAYSYDGECIYLTLGPDGRKMECIQNNRRACFVVCELPEGFGMGNMSWASVICDGEIEQVTDPETIKKAVRTGERHMGMPEGTWDSLLQATLQNPAGSSFWKITVQQAGGKKA